MIIGSDYFQALVVMINYSIDLETHLFLIFLHLLIFFLSLSPFSSFSSYHLFVFLLKLLNWFLAKYLQCLSLFALYNFLKFLCCLPVDLFVWKEHLWWLFTRTFYLFRNLPEYFIHFFFLCHLRHFDYHQVWLDHYFDSNLQRFSFLQLSLWDQRHFVWILKDDYYRLLINFR